MVWSLGIKARTAPAPGNKSNHALPTYPYSKYSICTEAHPNQQVLLLLQESFSLFEPQDPSLLPKGTHRPSSLKTTFKDF